MNSDVLAPGFADPVFDSQRRFRALLHAMAHPGSVVTLPRQTEAPAPLAPATAALCLTLVDFETPLWLDDAVAAEGAASDYLRFHCGCPPAQEPASARFAVIGAPDLMPSLTAFDPGVDEYPDRSATLILQVAELAEGRGRHLTGPGIEREARLQVDGLPDGFWREWRDNNALYPLGVDVVFAAETRIAALPRSTRVEE